MNCRPASALCHKLPLGNKADDNRFADKADTEAVLSRDRDRCPSLGVPPISADDKIATPRLCPASDQVGTLLRNHDCRRIGISADHRRHDRRVADAQAVEAVHPEVGADHAVVACPHSAGACRMPSRPRVATDVGSDLGVVRENGLRRAGPNTVEGVCVQKLADPFLLGDGKAQVVGLRQVVRIDQRRVERVVGGQRNGAAALRTARQPPRQNRLRSGEPSVR